MTGAIELRRELLRRLFVPQAPDEATVRQLASQGWDSDEELVELEPQHVRALLQRFVAGGVTTNDVEAWANALEGRDDVSMTPEVTEVVYALANPTLDGPLTRERALELLDKLD